jgi:hypothetical protein
VFNVWWLLISEVVAIFFLLGLGGWVSIAPLLGRRDPQVESALYFSLAMMMSYLSFFSFLEIFFNRFGRSDTKPEEFYIKGKG